MIKAHKFNSEAEMCELFIGAIKTEYPGWVVYPETGGFDILLVRKEDGFQIGIEAKLKLNAKVVCQAAEKQASYATLSPGPDCRAVLVPELSDLSVVCNLLGIQVIHIYHPADENSAWRREYFTPILPDFEHECRTMEGMDWPERCPYKRLSLPDYIPDTGAGHSAPVRLTVWKIKAIKIAILLERQGYITRKDFKQLGIDMTRWTQNGMKAWLHPIRYVNPDAEALDEKGLMKYVATQYMPKFKEQHPKNYAEIEADFDKWNVINKEEKE